MMKYINKIGVMMTAGLVLAATSCTDFSDYNDTPVDKLSEANRTIWENIVDHSDQLSDFATLLQRAGFEQALDSAHAYTVWAPVNGSFSVADYESMSQQDLLNQFVKNHVADYVHLASGDVYKTIHSLNGKSHLFAGNGAYTYDDNIAISGTGLPGTNGLLYMIDKVAPYYPNIYDYIETPLENDSLFRKYVQSYDVHDFDLNNSVKGPIVDGVQTYLEEVYNDYNALFRQMGAKVEVEDSSYTLIYPTDKAYNTLYDRLMSLYKYLETTSVQDVAKFENAKGDGINELKRTIKAADIRTRVVRNTIARNLVLSNNDAYNQWLADPEAVNVDTIRTTVRTKLSNPDAILNEYRVGDPVQLSNGKAYLVDSIAFYPWETFNPELRNNTTTHITNFFSSNKYTETVPDTLLTKVFGDDIQYTSYRYARIEPAGATSVPTVFVSLPNVRSTTYNFYVVFMPAAWDEFGADARPNKLNFELNYCKPNNDGITGTTTAFGFSSAKAAEIKAAATSGQIVKQESTAALNMNTAFENDPTKLDTVFIGQFTFPVAYHGLKATVDERGMVNPGDFNDDLELAPNLKITSPINGFNKTQLATYNRELRIAAVVMKPVELDEYENQ